MTYDRSISGPFQQTLFLGASIANFSTTLGWNTSSSELTVELVEDPKVKDKIYYDGVMNPQIHHGPDMFNPPPLGSPVFFRYGLFTYTGILQNWKENHGTNKKTYTVRVISPQDLLEGTQIILGNYNGAVRGIPNFINVYGYLEEFGSLDRQTRLLGATPQNFIDAQYSCGGYGGADRNDTGIAWYQVREALCSLINGMTISQLLSGGITINTPLAKYGCSVNFRGYRYILDISSLPPIDNLFRIADEQISLLELTTRVCEYYGADFFVELIPISRGTSNRVASVTDNNPYSTHTEEWAEWFSGHLSKQDLLYFIKVRPASRRNQPEKALSIDISSHRPITLRLDSYGTINEAIDSLNLPVSTKSRGLELRNEVANVVVLGDNRCDIEQVFYDTADSIMPVSGFLDQQNSVSTSRQSYSGRYDTDAIWQYWGKHDDGYPIASYGKDHRHYAILNLKGKFSDQMSLVLRYYIDGIAHANDLNADIPYYITGKEAAAVLTGDKEVWMGIVEGSGYSDHPNSTVSSYLNKQRTAIAHLWEMDPSTSNAVDMFNSTITQVSSGSPMCRRLGHGVAKAYNIHASDFRSAYLAGQLTTESIDSQAAENVDVLFEYLKRIVDENYGRKYLINIPYIAGVRDSDNIFNVRTNYQTADGAWTDANSVLGIGVNDSPLAIFQNPEDGKLQCFVHATNPYPDGAIDLSSYSRDNYYMATQNSVYLKANVEGLVFLDPINLLGPRVLISIDNPLHPFNIVVDNSGLIKMDWKSAASLLLDIAPTQGKPGSDTTHYPFKPYPLSPDAAAIPLLSNTNTYGPWFAGSPVADAKTEIIRETSLNPWTYGSTYNMNVAGLLLAQSRLTNQFVSEMASITVPGAPIINLGNPLIQGGPEITNVEVTCGTDSITTTYTMRSYTQAHGTLARTRVDNIAKYGRLQAKTDRLFTQARLSEAANRSAVSVPGITAISKGDRWNRTSSTNFMLAHGEPEYLPSGNFGPEGINGQDWKGWDGSLIETDGITQSFVSTDIRKGLPELHAHRSASYITRAGMEQIGMFRPFTTVSGDACYMAEMPINAEITDEGPHTGSDCDPYSYYNRTNCIVATTLPPIKDEANPPICVTSLNPFLGSGVTNQGFVLGSGDGHDIEYITRDGTFPTNLSVIDKNEYSKEHWYRAIGLRGPLVMIGWGYDIHGRPVPNADQNNGRSQHFEEDWLRKPHKWKAGPVDLRWDDNRGVWTAPPAYNPVRFIADENYSSNGHFRAHIINNTSYAYSVSGTIVRDIMVRNPWQVPIVSGLYGWAIYDPNIQNSLNYYKYDLLSIDDPTFTCQTVGSGKAEILGCTSWSYDNITYRALNPVDTTGTPDIAGYTFTAKLSTMIDEITGSGYPTVIPITSISAIEGATMLSTTTVRIGRTGDTRPVTNSLSIPSGVGVNIQWGGNGWIVISAACYNTPVTQVI